MTEVNAKEGQVVSVNGTLVDLLKELARQLNFT